MLEQYRDLLESLPIEEVEAAAVKAEQLRDATPPDAPFFAELDELARIARMVADRKRQSPAN